MPMELPKEKVVVIMAPTASGKSRLSVEVASRYPSEIINSDKIQVYKGLDITTNKITLEEQLGVPHHLLGNIDSVIHPELSAAEFRSRASSIISEISGRGNLPIVVGGSNSFVYALLANEFNKDLNVFSESGAQVCSELRYNCCLIWIDVSLPVLDEYIKKRVDDMIDSGGLNELAKFHQYDMLHLEPNVGLTKSIGVPEFKEYVSRYGNEMPSSKGDQKQKDLYDKAVNLMKENTCKLAKAQMEKIKFLKQRGWDIKRLDATKSFMALLQGSKNWSTIWETQVLQPTLNIVNSLLEEP
ncbi:adenylate isopentenyltransferase 1, chloroplastic-like [Spinacia oleracea]|uniref:Adenylate isopentenyltransferase 1, chloroplastic-like n=1 Tax=Spinacia oleracea TaxID=3562 RepID=A0A9R0HTS7_SPIOL|nr:adenylate isopentenyltransferase 1, chloroplastic-like [Spinacia oleracea]